MKILVTGANGFVGKNLIVQLNYLKAGEVLKFNRSTDIKLLDQYCQECDFVFHLAGVNRPECFEEYREGNLVFTSQLLSLLEKYNNYCPILLSSSIQAELNNPYGISKREGEELLKSYGLKHNVQILIYRFPNIFGKWCRPNYNSVVATFCYNIARNLPIQISGKEISLSLVYIDDVITELICALNGKACKDGSYCFVQPVHEVTLGKLAEILIKFKGDRTTLQIPDLTVGSFNKKLYSTYLSYLPENEFKYPLKMNVDKRGSFTEIMRSTSQGQFSVNISKPGVEKGNHWHNTKIEKFVVVSGNARIQFRLPDSEKIIEYHVSGEKLEVVDIPVGYTHNIINEGTIDLITFMWSNECFNRISPDTYYMKVNEEME